MWGNNLNIFIRRKKDLTMSPFVCLLPSREIQRGKNSVGTHHLTADVLLLSNSGDGAQSAEV
jgi:hypothetical protein